MTIRSRYERAIKLKKVKAVLIQTQLPSDLKEALTELVKAIESIDVDISELEDKFPEIG